MVLILFHNRLYVADDLLKTKSKVLKELKQGKIQLGVYVIILPLGENDMLEIYPSYVLLQNALKDKKLNVVGIAGDRQTAFSLVEQMTMDCLNQNSNTDIRAFFEKDI